LIYWWISTKIDAANYEGGEERVVGDRYAADFT
jgi:hypothetical protein